MRFYLQVKCCILCIKIHQLYVKKLLIHFRVHRKIAASAQMDGWMATDGPLYTGLLG